MTDARLSAAVEAAARLKCLDYCQSGNIWDEHRPDVRDMHRDDIEHYVKAALAAADAWDREQGVMRFDPNTVRWSVHTKDTQPYRSDWLTRLGDDDDPDEPREPRPVPQRPDRWWRA